MTYNKICANIYLAIAKTFQGTKKRLEARQSFSSLFPFANHQNALQLSKQHKVLAILLTVSRNNPPFYLLAKGKIIIIHLVYSCQ